MTYAACFEDTFAHALNIHANMDSPRANLFLSGFSFARAHGKVFSGNNPRTCYMILSGALLAAL